MNNRLKNPSVWMPLALAVALVAGMWIGSSFFNSRHSWNSRTKLDTILELIDKNYVDEIDTDSILEASFSGLMSHLDPIRSTFPPLISRVSTKNWKDHSRASAYLSICSVTPSMCSK